MTATTPKTFTAPSATSATPATSASPEVSAAPEIPTSREVPAIPEAPTTELRLRAVDTLLADPEAIPDPLEVELYAYREQVTGETVG
jgi:hypothetical protein